MNATGRCLDACSPPRTPEPPQDGGLTDRTDDS